MRAPLDKIRREGLDALKARLGRAGMIRFMQQFETGEGDYAHERREWVDQTSLNEIKQRSKQVKGPSSRTENPPDILP